MYDTLTQEAVAYALQGNWENALDANLKLLKKDSKNISALNRTAKAFIETGDLKKAREYAQKVLTLDPDNRIAANCLKRWKHLKKVNPQDKKSTSREFFIEEAGRTKVVALVKLGEDAMLAELDNGDEAMLDVHQHKTCVCTGSGKYIGCLPDNIVAKMFNSSGDARYKIFIRSVDEHDVKVFLRKID